MIENAAAVKPAGWGDDSPLEIPDPEALRPDDWDDEEVSGGVGEGVGGSKSVSEWVSLRVSVNVSEGVRVGVVVIIGVWEWGCV
jgi:Calreticulin family